MAEMMTQAMRATHPAPQAAGAAAAEAARMELDRGVALAATEARLAEIDRLLNDPRAELKAERVWTLLAEVSGRDLARLAASRR